MSNKLYEHASNEDNSSMMQNAADSSEEKKPMPLIGGSEVYQKDNGTNYWYCRIKDGRDEFMFLDFSDLSEDDLLYDLNNVERVFSSSNSQKLKTSIFNALMNIPREGFRWIPVYEPSQASSGKIQFVPGKRVLTNISAVKWTKLFKNYSPENRSQHASKYTYFLYLLRILKDGYVTIDHLADHSELIGRFRNTISNSIGFDKTGETEFAGICGLIGNTDKEVVDPSSPSGYSTVSGSYMTNSKDCPASYETIQLLKTFPNPSSTGLMELIK